jgi:hypothetical protein
LEGGRQTPSRKWYWLLLLPFAGLLIPPIYATEDPELFGFPFFYWYQFAWVPISVAITYLVYTRTRTRGPPPERPPLEATPGSPTPGGDE